MQGRSQRSRIIIIGKIACWYTSESMQINQRRARASLETKQKCLHGLLLHIDSKTYRIGQEGSNAVGTEQRLVHALWIFEPSAKQRRNRQNTGSDSALFLHGHRLHRLGLIRLRVRYQHPTDDESVVHLHRCLGHLQM